MLDQKRFDHIFERAPLFANGRGETVDPHRTPVELIDDGAEKLTIERVETERVDFEQIERGDRDLGGDTAVTAHLGVIARAAQQAIRDTRRTARSLGDPPCAFASQRHTEDGCRSFHDRGQILGAVELEPLHDTEAITQRRGQKPCTRGGTHQRERR